MRAEPLSSRTVSGNADVEKRFVPMFGAGIYCRSCFAGADQALCGISAPGNTQLPVVQPGVY
jgi:hypothetical protein